MEYLIKQTRGKYSGRGTPEESGSIRDRRTPIQKTVSFKEEKKRPQNWFRRQLSRQMSRDYDLDEIEQATAVAAAAYVIASLNESAIPVQKVSQGPNASLDQVKSKEKATKPSTSKQPSGAGSMRNQEIPDNKEQDITVKIDGPVPSLKKTPTSTSKPALSTERIPTFSENDLKSQKVEPKKEVPTRRPEISVSKPDMPSKKPENAVPKPDLPSTSKPIGPTVKTQNQTPTKPGKGNLNADAWEKAELAKVKRRYEEVNARILSWENRKTTKARKKLDRTESEIEGIKLKTLEKYSSDMEAVTQIAEAARAKAAEKERNKELKNARILKWENKKKTKARQKLDRTEREIEVIRLKTLENFRKEMESVTQVAQAARAKAAEKERNEELKCAPHLLSISAPMQERDKSRAKGSFKCFIYY